MHDKHERSRNRAHSPRRTDEVTESAGLQAQLGNAAVARIAAAQHQDNGACAHCAPVQRSAVPGVLSRPGTAMDESLRTEMEDRFGGADFSSVRLHTGSAAHDAADEVQARAFTTGENIVLSRDVAPSDKHTMAHELTHVLQQREGPVAGTDNGSGLSVSDPSDRFEREAETVADSVTAGVRHEPVGAGQATGSQIARSIGSHRPDASDAAVQRMPKAESRQFYRDWAGDRSVQVTAEDRDWIWNELVRLAGGSSKATRMKISDAVTLLHDAGVTLAARNATRGPEGQQAEASGSRQQENSPVPVAEEAWRQRAAELQTELPEVENLTLTIDGLGVAKVAMLRNSARARPGMLAWFSHGYEDKHRITTNDPRQYGYAVGPEKSMNRTAPADVFQSLPQALEQLNPAATTEAPGQYVRQHHHTELTQEIDRVIALTKQCDVAVLLDFQWAPELAPGLEEARKADTPPLPMIIDGSDLRSYSALLILACRTPWSVQVAVEGKSRLVEAYAKELRERGTSPQTAQQQATERYEAVPEMDTVHP